MRCATLSTSAGAADTTFSRAPSLFSMSDVQSSVQYRLPSSILIGLFETTRHRQNSVLPRWLNHLFLRNQSPRTVTSLAPHYTLSQPSFSTTDIQIPTIPINNLLILHLALPHGLFAWHCMLLSSRDWRCATTASVDWKVGCPVDSQRPLVVARLAHPNTSRPCPFILQLPFFRADLARLVSWLSGPYNAYNEGLHRCV